jgi:hypothetical protein
MFSISNNYNVINKNELELFNIDYKFFSFYKHYSQNNPALFIDFKNNVRYSILCIKKLLLFKEKNIIFNSSSNGKNIKYIISNFPEEIPDALKAIEINNKKDLYTFVYEQTCNKLDKIWKKYNPCNFCNQICAASKENPVYLKPDGCCARAFDLSLLKKRKIFTKDSIHPCKYLGKTNGCTTQNLSCKFFICNYIKKNKLIQINPKHLILFQSFFSEKQKLILTFNYFHKKEELINKLLENNNDSIFWYSLKQKYFIDD